MAVLITTLGFPVLRALAFAVPVMGSVVLVNLSGNDNVKFDHAYILQHSIKK
jgi:hypothetical protein